MSTSPTVKLVSSDQQEFEVPTQVACVSHTIGNLLQDDSLQPDRIPLDNVTGRALAKTIEYCKQYVEHADCLEHDEQAKKKDEKKDEKQAKKKAWEAWQSEFLEIERAELFDLILAANYLHIQPLLQACCKRVAAMIKGKTVEEVRDIFGIKNDFTPEEEEQVRRENQWAFGP